MRDFLRQLLNRRSRRPGECLLWLPGRFRAYHCGREWVFENTITDAGLQWFLDLWRGVETPGFKYIALGTSDVATQYSQTQLGGEQIRKVIESFNPALPALESIVTFLDTEANFLIREIGLFAGAAATADPNTGILVARAVVNINKTAAGSLKIVREDRLGRAV